MVWASVQGPKEYGDLLGVKRRQFGVKRLQHKAIMVGVMPENNSSSLANK